MQQERLFDPGPRGPNRWKLHPDNWVKRPDVVYHASDQPALPRHDRGPNFDPGYGNSSGMHFGDKTTALDRASSAFGTRDYIHTARLVGEQFTPANSGRATKGIKPAPVWSDEEANYNEITDKAVRQGKVVPYRNAYENVGAVSYRALPEVTKTWSEDVKDDPAAHPALKHLADKNYNPTMGKYDNYSPMDTLDLRRNGPLQHQLFGADVVKGGKAVSHHINVDDAADERFNRAVVKGEYGVGFKQNNVVKENLGSIDQQSRAVPRLRPTRP